MLQARDKRFSKARVSSSNVRVVVSKDIKEHSCNLQASSGSDNIIKSSKTCRICGKCSCRRATSSCAESYKHFTARFKAHRQTGFYINQEGSVLVVQ